MNFLSKKPFFRAEETSKSENPTKRKTTAYLPLVPRGSFPWKSLRVSFDTRAPRISLARLPGRHAAGVALSDSNRGQVRSRMYRHRFSRPNTNVLLLSHSSRHTISALNQKHDFAKVRQVFFKFGQMISNDINI